LPGTAHIANIVIAEADDYKTVEGSIYFPPSSIKDKSMLESSSLTTNCPWKGATSYYYPQSRRADIEERSMKLPGAEREGAEHQRLRCVL
jgi:uncharacterized protein (DUF427 family)